MMQVGKLYKMKRRLLLWTDVGAFWPNNDQILLCVESRDSGEVVGKRRENLFQHMVLIGDKVYKFPSMTSSELNYYIELAIGKKQQ